MPLPPAVSRYENSAQQPMVAPGSREQTRNSRKTGVSGHVCVCSRQESQAKGLVNRGGNSLSSATSGTHGQPGTIARPVSRSMAFTIC